MEVPVGDLLIRDISEALKRNIAERAEREGHSLSEEAKLLMQKGLAASEPVVGVQTLNAWDSLRAVLGPKTDEEARDGEDFARILEEIEAERKRDFGRPVEGFE
jgi:plasmid stability protein